VHDSSLVLTAGRVPPPTRAGSSASSRPWNAAVLVVAVELLCLAVSRISRTRRADITGGTWHGLCDMASRPITRGRPETGARDVIARDVIAGPSERVQLSLTQQLLSV